MIGFDTDALIDMYRGDSNLKKLVQNIKEPLVLNQFNYLEIMFGLDLANPQHRMEEEFYDTFFDSLVVFPLDAKASKKASEIMWGLKKKGKIIEPFDCVIAGIFLVNGVNKIITKNVKHFDKISGVKVLSY